MAKTPVDPPPYIPSPSKSPPDTPYVPLAAICAHIDRLGLLEVQKLEATSSHAATEYYDILPLFQMYQAILKRDDSQFTENLVEKPPQYDLPPTPTPPPPPSVTSEVDAHNENVAVTRGVDDRDVQGYSVIDKIDLLPKGGGSPFEIEIYVTKGVPQPYVDKELETRLKHYSPGELVHGYLIITNTSSLPQTFGLFTVLLEGTMKCTEPAPPLAEGGIYNKILMKKFLRMYDLHASYGYTMVPNLAGIEYQPHTVDDHDNTIIALPEHRVLEPRTKYKKFFTFKLPTTLLDNVCGDQIDQHILPPPLFGLDRTCFSNLGLMIEVNKVLGYGHLDKRGTPLLTKDYCYDNVSISYTIEAKFIDRKLSDAAVSEFDIDDPEKYVISKLAQYFLRFVPNQNHPRSGTTWGQIDAIYDNADRQIERQLARMGSEAKDKNIYDYHDCEKPKIADQTGVVSNTVQVVEKKKKGIFQLVSVVTGTATTTIILWNEKLGYSPPKLLKRYNGGANSLETITFSIEFAGVTPPVIASVDVALVAWTYTLDYAIPIEFFPDFFEGANFEDTLAQVKHRADHYRYFLDQNPGIKVSRATLGYLRSVKTLGFKRDKIDGYFAPWTPTKPKWHQLDGEKWKTVMTVALKTENRFNDNIVPSFQTCLTGRLYRLQLGVKMKGEGKVMEAEVPITIA